MHIPVTKQPMDSNWHSALSIVKLRASRSAINDTLVPLVCPMVFTAKCIRGGKVLIHRAINLSIYYKSHRDFMYMFVYVFTV